MPYGKDRLAGFTTLVEFMNEREVDVYENIFKFQLFLLIITEMPVDGEIR